MSFNIFDIAGSGMTAQRVKMDTIASNIANIHTTRKPDGSKGVYVKKDVSFRTIYEDTVNRGFSNFQSNNPDAQFDPKTGNLLINANVALNNGWVAYKLNKFMKEKTESKQSMTLLIPMQMKKVTLICQT